MKIARASLILVAVCLADEAADRAAFERIVGAINDYQTAGSKGKPPAGLFTANAENELGRLWQLDRQLVPISNQPWSEVTRPRIVIQSVRFITPEIALVDAANTQYGSTILVRRMPVLFVMKKEAGDWRIASLRLLADFTTLPDLPIRRAN